MNAGPQLRDIHIPAEPGWWPPTFAAVLVFAVALVALVLLVAWAARRLARRRRVRALGRFFDRELARADSEQERLQHASACLRRAVSRAHPDAVATTGASWLQLLDGDDPARPFSTGPGRLLADGPYRVALSPGEGEEAIGLARARFVQLGGQVDA